MIKFFLRSTATPRGGGIMAEHEHNMGRKFEIEIRPNLSVIWIAGSCWPRLNPWKLLWRWICLFIIFTCSQNHSSPSLRAHLLDTRTHNVPSAIHKLAMKPSRCMPMQVKANWASFCSRFPHLSASLPHLNCLMASVFWTSGACRHTNPRTH